MTYPLHISWIVSLKVREEVFFSNCQKVTNHFHGTKNVRNTQEILIRLL